MLIDELESSLGVNHVLVQDASQIPALADARSHLDRFTRLINLPEYDQWAQA